MLVAVAFPVSFFRRGWMEREISYTESHVLPVLLRTLMTTTVQHVRRALERELLLLSSFLFFDTGTTCSQSCSLGWKAVGFIKMK